MKDFLLFLSYMILRRRRRWVCYSDQFQENVLVDPTETF